VTELGDWLMSAEPSRQITARQVLQEAADRDVPRVADAARQLLGASVSSVAAAVPEDSPTPTLAMTVAVNTPRAGPPGRPVSRTAQASPARQSTTAKWSGPEVRGGHAAAA